MFKKIGLLFALSILINVLGFSQTQHKIDSLVNLTSSLPIDTNLVNTYEKIAKLYLRIQLDSVKIYAQKMIDLSTKLNYDKGLAMGYNWFGESLLWQGDYQSTLKYFRKTNKIFEKSGKNMLWARSLEVIANVYSISDKSDSAVLLYNKALKFHEDNNDTVSAAKVLVNIGKVYSKIGDFTTALNYYFNARLTFKTINNDYWFMATERSIATVYGRQFKNDSAISIYKRIIEYQIKRDDYFNLAESYTNIGVLYEDKKDFDNAMEAQKKSLKYRLLVNDKRGTAITRMNIGSLYFSMEIYDSVVSYLDNSRKMFEMSRSTHPLAFNLMLTGEYYQKTMQLDKAEEMYFRAYNISLDNNLKGNVREAAKALSAIYEEMFEYKNALKYAKIYKVQYDSLINEENIRQQTVAKEGYKYKLQLFEKEKEIDAEKQQKYYAIIVGIIVAIGLMLLIFYRWKLHKTKLLQIEQQNEIAIQKANLNTQREERKRVANILHDNLAHVILNSQAQIKKIIADTKNSVTNQMLLQIEENLEFMNKLAKVASYELEFSLVLENNLADQFEIYIDRVQHSHSPRIIFHYNEKSHFDDLTDNHKSNIFSVFQEMLGNAIKYSKAKTITISLLSDENKTVLQVDDDGIGFDYEEVRHGQGFPNMKERAENLNGTFTFESEKGFGTKLKFII